MKPSLLLFFLLLPLALLTGSVSLTPTEVWQAVSASPDCDEAVRFIVINTRLPQLLTAVLSGASLSVCGLVMQTLFANPLADPSLLGVNSGASLGAALAMLTLGGTMGVAGSTFGMALLTTASAFVGACTVIVLIVLFSSLMRGSLALLVAGVMLSFAISAIISLLSFYATSDGVHSFIVWGLGNFSGITLQQIPFYSLLTIIPILLVCLQSRNLNALLLGTDYAANLGVRVKRVRTYLLLLTGFLTAVVTATCGPISFIGLAVPHMARLALHTANHQKLLPAVAVIGADVALLALIASHAAGERGVIPLAAITPLIGVPVVLYILLRK